MTLQAQKAQDLQNPATYKKLASSQKLAAFSYLRQLTDSHSFSYNHEPE
jgi:hypothetical protein